MARVYLDVCCLNRPFDDQTQMTLEEIRVAGLRALSRDLGAVGLVRFLQQFERGSGDYTTERVQWLEGHTVGDVIRHIKEQRHAVSDSQEESAR